ncbi:hypothetical protein EsVE80_09760 [Enterococcus saigonensis]|uniref:Glycosyltransferase RgtA/B/C/D-like domain-containing protein n=1 Tax=Enterococcus saigonensis TaxID=1805431 RepID=A0A679IAW5_9ENTE|nr:DUF6020 family protein [Enterococcus saigonensis]BCA85453.1 hypothetical protein EsVE80_09760 [Enterococcus saigonensis]
MFSKNFINQDKKIVVVNFLKALLLTVFLDNRLTVLKVNTMIYDQIDNRILQRIYYFLYDISAHISGIPITYIFMFVGLFFLLTWTAHLTTKRLTIIQHLISTFFSMMILFKYALDLTLPVNQTSYFYLLVSSTSQFIKTFLTFVSWYILFNTVQRILEVLLIRVSKVSKDENIIMSLEIKKKNWKKDILKNTFIVFFLWLPFLIIDYPGVLIYDGVTQIMQYNGYDPLRTDHPISSTLLLNYCFNIGKFIGSGNLGLFIYVLVQSLSLAFSFGAVITWATISFDKINLKKIFIPMCGLLPVVLTFIPLISKDIIFASMFVLLNLLLAIILFNQSSKLTLGLFIGVLLSSTISMLFRKNVLYVIILFIVISAILLAFNKSKFINKYFVLALLISVVLFKGIDTGLGKLYDANTDGLRRESLSLPFQQTARYIKYHGDEMTSDEKKKIDRVLKIDNIDERYNPKLSNNVKDYHNENASKEELKEYFFTWIDEFFKHPVTYFEATIDQNVSLFTLFTKNEYFTHLTAGYREAIPRRNQIYEDYNLKVSKTHWTLQEIKLKVFQIFDRIPGLGLLDNPSTYIIVLFLFWGISIKYKLKRFIYISLPTFIMLLTLIAGPVVQGYTRYTALFIFVFPILFVSFLIDFQNNKKKRTYR